jgi:2'-5' RNA ligase
VSSQRARLFVALELPTEVREELIVWRDTALGDLEDVRPIGGHELHVTLCFLGWREHREVQEIAGACEVLSGRGAPELALGDAVLLPRRRPRVLAIALEDPDEELASARAELASGLEAGGFYEAEQRPFYGHVTLARAGRRARIPRALVLEPGPPRVRFRASRVVLYQSHLRRGGAQYEALATVELRM